MRNLDPLVSEGVTMEGLRAEDPAQIGPFRLLARLGIGGMGRVYLARGRDQRLAAVKVVHETFAVDDSFRARFAREVATARRVHGSWVTPVLDADPDAPRPWLATEYVPGPSLEEAVRTSGPLPEPALGVLAARLATALAELHALNLVHRDVKPSNVLLATDGPRLIDFGIARAVDATRITHTGLVVGTPAFMSPEQANGEPEGAASDVFSLAGVLAFAASGKGPFGPTSNPVAQLLRVTRDEPDLAGAPDWLRGELGACLAKTPAERPTASDLAARFATRASAPNAWPPPIPSLATPLTIPIAVPRGAKNPPLAPLPPGPPAWEPVPGRGGPHGRRARWPLWTAAAAAVALLAGAAVLIWPSTSGAPTPRGHGSPPATVAQPRLFPLDWVANPAVGISMHDQPLLVPDGSTVRILDPNDYAVRDELKLPYPVQGIQRNPDGTKAYLQITSNMITTVDLRTKQQSGDITLPGGDIESYVITPDAGRMVVVSDPGTLTVVDLAAGAMRSVPLGVAPSSDCEISPDGHRAYVSTRAVQPALVEVDLDSMLVTSVTVPLDPTDAHLPRADAPTLSPDGRWLYALAARSIIVLDTTTNTVRRRIPERGGSFAGALALSPNGRYLYVCTEQGELRVIDLTTDRQVSTGRASAPPQGGLAISEDGRKLYLVVRAGLDVFDTAAFT